MPEQPEHTRGGPPGDLVDRASRGDDLAIDELLERHLPGLRAFVRLRAGPVIRARESCSDLVQSVCREILQDLGDFSYEGEQAFRRWLYTAALRKILDRNKFYRREKRDAARDAAPVRGTPTGDVALLDCYGSFCTPSRDAMANEELARVEVAFDELPENYREIITLARVADMSYAELAEHYGKSEAYCRTLLSRALARLARLMNRPG